jgi:hypothetical protein
MSNMLEKYVIILIIIKIPNYYIISRGCNNIFRERTKSDYINRWVMTFQFFNYSILWLPTWWKFSDIYYFDFFVTWTSYHIVLINLRPINWINIILVYAHSFHSRRFTCSNIPEEYLSIYSSWAQFINTIWSKY